MALYLRSAAAGLCAAIYCTQALGQADPQAVMDRLLRQQMQRGERLEFEERQRFDDRQRQRARAQQEDAYDREQCWKSGYRGPDVEQCVRDSAAWRRGYRGQAPARPGIGCTTVDLGGVFDTVCD